MNKNNFTLPQALKRIAALEKQVDREEELRKGLQADLAESRNQTDYHFQQAAQESTNRHKAELTAEQLQERLDRLVLPRPPQVGGTHYGDTLQPWDLQCHMPSTGDVFIDARRTDVIEYVFRLKPDHKPSATPTDYLLAAKRDAEKALHNCQAIIARVDQLFKA